MADGRGLPVYKPRTDQHMCHYRICNISIALSWPLAIVSAGGIIVLFGGMHFLWRPVRNLGRRMKLEHDSIADIMLATLQGMRTLRAFGLEQEWRRRFEAASGKVERTSVTFERYYTLVSATIQIGYIFLLVAIVFISSRIEIPFSSTLTFVALLYRLQPNVRELQSNVLAILQLQASISSVVEMLDRTDKRYFGTGGEPFGGLRKEIRFEHVSLSYPGAASPSLDRINAVLPAGSVTAIVGPSGAGKTTIVNLLLGLYRQDTGAILVDGVHLDRLSRDSWLARIAVAGQDVDLVEGTVSYNLRLAAPRATLPAMRAAAAIVRMDGVLEGLSQGFDSWIGNRGLKLSGGQRQRLGIARALLREPDILLLDEATSALDRGLELAILSATLDRLAGRTLVIVTHRPEIAMLADQVICMDAGRVVECTSPAELRARPTSFFWALFPEASRGSTVKVH
jgi:ABC-type multidrug transport system fused ATPase/permease subunit